MVDEKKTFEDVTEAYKTYGKRWLVLSVVVILNLSGAMVWLTFTPVAYKAATYYGVGLDVINWLSLVFNFSGIFFGAVATYVLEAYGLRPALYLSGGLTFIGAAVRIASVAESLPDEGKVALLFVGQVLVAIGQPFSMYAPAKTAASWFPEHQRALANTIGAVANPIGVVIAGLISPLFVNYDNGDFYVMNLLITMTAPTALAALMVVFVMTTGNPPTPPSAGSNTEEEYFGSGVKKILRNKNYMLLVLTVGGGVGLYSAFATLLEQLLCPYGYTDSMAGICSAVLTGCGVIGAAIVGIYCDYSKQFSTTLKASYVCVVIGIIIFCVVFHINMGYLILILIAGIGLFSFGIYPIGVELGVEATYPVGVATSSGLIMMSGQIQAIVLVLILQVIGRPMSPEEVIKYDSKCHTVIGSDTTTAASTFLTSTYSDLMTTGGSETLTTYDMSLSIYVCAAYMGLLCIVLLAFFRPIYNRMAAEQDGRDLTSSYENVIPSKYNEKSVISNL